MAENHLIHSKDERAEIFSILSDIVSSARNLAGCSRPMFNGKRYVSDSELARRLSISKSTLANYRQKGLFGYYSLEGKIIYDEDEVETYLYNNSHPPFK